MQVLKLCFFNICTFDLHHFYSKYFDCVLVLFKQKRILNLILISIYYCEVGLGKFKVGRIF